MDHPNSLQKLVQAVRDNLSLGTYVLSPTESIPALWVEWEGSNGKQLDPVETIGLEVIIRYPYVAQSVTHSGRCNGVIRYGQIQLTTFDPTQNLIKEVETILTWGLEVTEVVNFKDTFEVKTASTACITFIYQRRT